MRDLAIREYKFDELAMFYIYQSTVYPGDPYLKQWKLTVPRPFGAAPPPPKEAHPFDVKIVFRQRQPRVIKRYTLLTEVGHNRPSASPPRARVGGEGWYTVRPDESVIFVSFDESGESMFF